MKNNRKKLFQLYKLLVISIFLLSLFVNDTITAQTTVSRIVRTADNNYIEVNGQPYLMYGVQFRLDNYYEKYSKTTAPVNQYFEKDRSAGFRTVAIPLNWFDL